MQHSKRTAKRARKADAASDSESSDAKHDSATRKKRCVLPVPHYAGVTVLTGNLTLGHIPYART